MAEFLLELGAICLLACLNGFFAMAELAVLTARKSTLARLAGQGRPGAGLALRLANNPDSFLSSVQLGVTTLGVVAGMFGGAAFSGDLAAFLRALGLGPQPAAWISFIVAAAVASCLTIVLGELVPKRLAINHAETLAVWSAPIMRLFMRSTAPAVAFLAASSRFILRLLGQKERIDNLSEEDVRALAKEAATLGVLAEMEREMIERVIRFGNRGVSSLMTYRADMAWLDADAPDEENLARIRAAGHSHFPVSRKYPGAVFGVVAVKDLFAAYLRSGRLDLAGVAREPLFVPETLGCLDLLALFRKTGATLAVVVDEYGDVQGVAASRAVFSAIVGGFGEKESGRPEDPAAEGEPLILDGGAPMDEVLEMTGLDGKSGDAHGFTTLGGFIMARLGRVPSAGEGFCAGGWRFEAHVMDGRRVAKARLTPLRDGAPACGADSGRDQ